MGRATPARSLIAIIWALAPASSLRAGDSVSRIAATTSASIHATPTLWPLANGLTIPSSPPWQRAPGKPQVEGTAVTRQMVGTLQLGGPGGQLLSHPELPSHPVSLSLRAKSCTP